MRFRRVVAALVVILTIESLAGQGPAAGHDASPGSGLLEPLDEYVEAVINEWRVPGAAVAIVEDGAVVLARGYGVRKAGGAAAVTHWEGDTFYVRRPVPDDASVDWLVSFDVDSERVASLSIERLGWHEASPRFVRVDE